jgi:transcriptional regulator with XRE-family HTH domain
MSRPEPGLLPALLRHFRTRRGLSQLDLALAADVSARHLSFLETGRAQPSREMVLRLGATLDLSLRDQNSMLRAAGFGAEFAEPGLAGGMPDAITQAITRMLAQHEPFPMVVLDRCYNVLQRNDATRRLLSKIIADPSALPARPNLLHVLFDPRLARSAVVDWERTARTLGSRVHRESLARPGDAELAAVARSLFDHPDVPREFRQPDFSAPSEPTIVLRLRVEGMTLAFLSTVTVFSAPQNVTLDELRLESYFPLDDATARACERFVDGGQARVSASTKPGKFISRKNGRTTAGR